MRTLRRKDRAISEEEAMDILNRAKYGILSTVGKDEKPYGVPLNFCIIDRCIYFHSALDGHKIDNLNYNKYVSFCAVGNTEILPNKFSTKYESIIVAGEAEEVFEMDKQKALEKLLHKYSPNFIKEGIKHIDDFRNQTKVFKIVITNISGKARKK